MTASARPDKADSTLTPSSGRRFYFAYGVNMSRPEMRQRCPQARFLGAARLPGHRFLITAAQVATVQPAEGAAVWGALWEIGPRCERTLDRFEAVHRLQYRRGEVRVETAQGAIADCLIYLCRDCRPGRPYAGYLERIEAARRDLGLPR